MHESPRPLDPTIEGTGDRTEPNSGDDADPHEVAGYRLIRSLGTRRHGDGL